MSNSSIDETVKLYENCTGPLKNRSFNEFYTDYRVKQNEDEEKRAEATRLLAMGMGNDFPNEKTKKLIDHYRKIPPEKLEIQASKLYNLPIESCTSDDFENDDAINKRVFIKGRVKDLCKLFQKKMDLLERANPETKKNNLINQIQGTVIKIQENIDKFNSPKSPDVKLSPKPECTSNRVEPLVARYKDNIKKTNVVNKTNDFVTNPNLKKSVNELVKNIDHSVPSGNSSRALLFGLSAGSSDVGGEGEGRGVGVYPEERPISNPSIPPPMEERRGNLGSHGGEEQSKDVEVGLKSTSKDEVGGAREPLPQGAPLTEELEVDDLLREIDEMIMNQASNDEFNLSDDEDQVDEGTIDKQFAWFFKAISSHVISKSSQEGVDQAAIDHLDWFLN